MQRNRNIPAVPNNIDGIKAGRRSSGRSQRGSGLGNGMISDITPDRSRVHRSGDVIDEARALRRDGAKLNRREQKRAQQNSQEIPKKGRIKKRIKKIFIILLVLILVGGGYFGYKSFSKLKNVFRGGGSSIALCSEVAPEKLQSEGDGRVNILLLGIGGDKQPDGPNLTDSMMVMSINPLNNTVSLLSLPRDLWVDMGDDEYAKINEAYQNGLYEYQNANPDKTDLWPAIQMGFSTADAAVSKALGITINFNVLLSFEAFEQAIDAVGGVDITVPEDLIDYSMAWQNNGSPIIAAKGEQHMDSKQALMYSRSRYGSDRGDYDRAERQRAMIVALQKKVLSAGTLANPIKVSQLIDALGNNIRTDIGAGERTCLINIARKVNGSDVKSVDLYEYVAGDTIGGQSVQIPKAGIYDYSEIQSFVHNELKDSYIARENAEIAIYNGSGSEGLGTQTAELLTSYGYRVGVVETAPAGNYNQTQIIDTTTKDSPKYTLHYLEKRLSGSISTDLPTGIQHGSAKIVILLGSDATSN